MRLGVDPARDGEAGELERSLLLLASHRVPIHEERADVCGADAGANIELDRQSLTRVLVPRQVGQEASGVHEDGVTTRGPLVGDPVVVQSTPQVGRLADPVRQVGLVQSLGQADGERREVAPGQTAIRHVALARDDQRLDVRNMLALFADAEETAHVGDGVLLRTHREDVRVREELLGDLTRGLVRIARLALLDEERVLRVAGGIDHDREVMTFRDLGGRLHVGHRHRLAPDGVVRDRHDDASNVLRAVLGDDALQHVDVHVALERSLTARVEALRADAVDRPPACEPDMGACGVEEGVGDHEHAGPVHEYREEHLLSGATLVYRLDVLVAEDVARSIDELVVAAPTRVGLVAAQHGSPLVVAHRARPAVGL